MQLDLYFCRSIVKEVKVFYFDFDFDFDFESEFEFDSEFGFVFVDYFDFYFAILPALRLSFQLIIFIFGVFILQATLIY